MAVLTGSPRRRSRQPDERMLVRCNPAVNRAIRRVSESLGYLQSVTVRRTVDSARSAQTHLRVAALRHDVPGLTRGVPL